MIHLALTLYTIAWRMVLPLLKRSPRLGLGWQQRTLIDAAQGPFDLWIQAASGGESMLINMVLEGLEALLPEKSQWRILVTSGTKQGIDILNTGCTKRLADNMFDITVAYFPFDAPYLMDKAFTRFTPKLAVIVETELWPGFLISAKKNRIPVLVMNGRMSIKSFRWYKYFRKFFIKYGPHKVMAISPVDQQRFCRIVGPDKVSLMNNIKFDRIAPRFTPSEDNPIAGLLPKNSPLLLFGSIRRQEEQKILQTMTRILATRPDITIGLFPKHIERADPWIQLLHKENIQAVKRSEISSAQIPGSVIVWDVFGELAGAYALARACFVGGSLENLGGQNFLEPLVFGLKPIIGPYWKNFAWVGQEIITSGLVQEVADENQLVAGLLTAIDTDPAKDQVIKQVRDFFEPRQGGTLKVCQEIIDTLHLLEKR